MKSFDYWLKWTKSQDTVTMPIEDIMETIFVRRSLNEDRAIFFEEQYRNKAKVPPIWITADHELLAGRHRKSGATRAEKQLIDCIVFPNLTKAEMLMIAFQENLGGSLPPTRSDIEFAIRQMLEAKMVGHEIVAQLPQIPPGSLQTYIRNARSRIAQDKINKALALMVDEGCNMDEACKKTGVSGTD